MTSPRLSTYVRIAFVAVAAGVMTACAPVQHYPEPAQYHAPRVVYYDYWYYPAIGSYYDPRTHVYIYYERNHWIRTRALPVHVRPHLGRHVVVRSQHDRPYEAYPRHRKQYVPERYRKSEPAARATPDDRGNRVRRQDINQENSAEQYRNRDNQRDEMHNDNYKKHLSQQRAPESRDTQPPVTVRNRDVVPKKRDLPAVVLPVTQDQGREHEQHKEDKWARTKF